VSLNIKTEFTGDHEAGYNTIAEIPGVDPALDSEVVMVGAHPDSRIAGTGATDDGAGTIVAMEAMRILTAVGVKPRRTG
jgi:carboxypeptidase Q